jgi:hypothetical protein
MNHDLLRQRLEDLKGLPVAVTLKTKDGGTHSILSSVGVDYIGLKCNSEANELLIPLDVLVTIIRKS